MQNITGYIYLDRTGVHEVKPPFENLCAVKVNNDECYPAIDYKDKYDELPYRVQSIQFLKTKN